MTLSPWVSASRWNAAHGADFGCFCGRGTGQCCPADFGKSRGTQVFVQEYSRMFTSVNGRGMCNQKGQKRLTAQPWCVFVAGAAEQSRMGCIAKMVKEGSQRGF